MGPDFLIAQMCWSREESRISASNLIILGIRFFQTVMDGAQGRNRNRGWGARGVAGIRIPKPDAMSTMSSTPRLIRSSSGPYMDPITTKRPPTQ